MKVRAELEFEVSDVVNEDLKRLGVGLASYLHDGIDIAFNRQDAQSPLPDCELVGIKVLDFSSGTLYERLSELE